MMKHRFEEIPAARAEPRELAPASDKWPKHPAHLRADQSKDDNPQPKDGLDIATDRALELLERAQRIAARQHRWKRRHFGNRTLHRRLSDSNRRLLRDRQPMKSLKQKA